MCRMVSYNCIDIRLRNSNPKFLIWWYPHIDVQNIYFMFWTYQSLTKSWCGWVVGGGGVARWPTLAYGLHVCLGLWPSRDRKWPWEYLFIMNVDYFVPISYNLFYYTTILPWNTSVTMAWYNAALSPRSRRAPAAGVLVSTRYKGVDTNLPPKISYTIMTSVIKITTVNWWHNILKSFRTHSLVLCAILISYRANINRFLWFGYVIYMNVS